MLGNINMNGRTLNKIQDPSNDQDCVNKRFCDQFVNQNGGQMNGILNMDDNKITNLGTPTENEDACTKAYADTKLSIQGGTVIGNIIMSNHQIKSLSDPTEDGDSANKRYVDKHNRFNHSDKALMNIYFSGILWFSSRCSFLGDLR